MNIQYPYLSLQVFFKHLDALNGEAEPLVPYWISHIVTRWLQILGGSGGGRSFPPLKPFCKNTLKKKKDVQTCKQEVEGLQPQSKTWRQRLKSRQWPMDKNSELTLVAHRTSVMWVNAQNGSLTFLFALLLAEQEMQTVINYCYSCWAEMK